MTRVFGPTVFSFANNDTCKLGKTRLHPIPDPHRDVFRRGVFEPFDVIQIIMVKLLQQGLVRGLDGEEVSDKASDGIEGAFKPQLHPVGMAVQPAAPVLFGDIWQKVRRIETKSLRNPHKDCFMAGQQICDFAG